MQHIISNITPILMGLTIGWLSQYPMPQPIQEEDIQVEEYWHVYTTFEEMEWYENNPSYMDII